MNKLQILTKGLIKENPTFVLLLGMCPTLGTTTSAINGLGMGVATLFVLTCSNVAISLIKNLIPDKVRIPAFIVVIASFVTIRIIVKLMNNIFNRVFDIILKRNIPMMGYVCCVKSGLFLLPFST